MRNPTGAASSELLFVDPSVSDIGTLLGCLRPEVEAIVLDAVRPAARQMAATLSGRRGLHAVHVIAHGAPGRIAFVGGEWSAETLAGEADARPAEKAAVGFQFRLPRRMYDVTARRHAQHPDGEPVNAGKSAPVAAKAAAIDAAQARPLTWKTVVKRALAVAVAGAALYLVLPKLIAVLGAWPRLSTLNPVWFTVCLAAELVSFTCNFALQRLALRTKDWFPVVTAGLTGNAVTSSLPGGSAAGAAVQFRMLTTAGFDTDTAVGGLTAFSLLEVGGLLALPIFALPAILAGVPVSRGLVHTALLGIAAFVLYAIFGVIVLRTDWPLATLGRVAQSLWNRITRGTGRR